MANEMIAPFATGKIKVDLKQRINDNYDDLKTFDGFKYMVLNPKRSYQLDAENLVVLPIWNIMINHSLGNLSVDTSVKQPPKKTLAILVEHLKHNRHGEYFAQFQQKKAVPIAYIYDTVTKHDAMVYAKELTSITLVNNHHNTTTNLMVPISVGFGNSIKVSGNIVDDQANTQALIKRLPYRIEKYDINDAATVNFDFDALGKLL